MLPRPRKESGGCWCAWLQEGKGRTRPAAGGDRSHPQPSQRAKVEEREPVRRRSQVGGLGKQGHASGLACRDASAHSRDHQAALLSFATLTILQSWPRARAEGRAGHGHGLKAKPWLGISPQQPLSQLQPGKGWAWGASMLRSPPRKALLPGELAQTQQPQAARRRVFRWAGEHSRHLL